MWLADIVNVGSHNVFQVQKLDGYLVKKINRSITHAQILIVCLLTKIGVCLFILGYSFQFVAMQSM